MTSLVWGSFDSFSQNAKKNKNRPDLFYYGITGGGNISVLEGAYGSLRRTYINDFVSYIKDRGYNASGSLNSIIGLNAGVMGGYNFAKRFSLESSLTFSQKGFSESVNYDYSDSVYTVKYNSSVKANLDYLDFTLGVRYRHSSGIKVFIGFVSGLNVNDRVYQSSDYSITYVNFPTSNLVVNQDSLLFIHQYY